MDTYNYKEPVDLACIGKRDPLFVDLVLTKAFSRLQGVCFLGGIDYTFVPNPNGRQHHARYNRFQHSLGVAKLALVYADKKELNECDRRLVYSAALLHDIGHSPLSHSLEPVFEQVLGYNHHAASKKVILGQVEIGVQVHQVLRSYSVDPGRVAGLISGEEDGFDSFFSGPINFDSIEGVMRTRQYIKNAVTATSPITLLLAAMRRETSRDEDIVDSFWCTKKNVYQLAVQSYKGLASDSICQSIAMSFADRLSDSDYFLTDRGLFSKIPEVKDAIVSFAKMGQYAGFLCSDKEYKSRNFFIDSSGDFFRRQDSQRYRQEKIKRKISHIKQDRPVTEPEHGVLFDE